MIPAALKAVPSGFVMVCFFASPRMALYDVWRVLPPAATVAAFQRPTGTAVAYTACAELTTSTSVGLSVTAIASRRADSRPSRVSTRHPRPPQLSA